MEKELPKINKDAVMDAMHESLEDLRQLEEIENKRRIKSIIFVSILGAFIAGIAAYAKNKKS